MSCGLGVTGGGGNSAEESVGNGVVKCELTGVKDGRRGVCSKEVEDVSKVRMRSILASCLAKEHSSLPKTVLIN